MKPAPARAYPLLYAFLTLLAAILLSWSHLDHHDKEAYATFARIAGERAGAAQAVHAHIIGTQSGIATHLSLQTGTHATGFDQFVRDVVSTAPIEAPVYGYVRAISGDRRAAFEADMSRILADPEFRIWEFDRTKNRVYARPRDQHYPIVDYWPNDSTHAPPGLDFAAIPERLALLRQAAALGAPVVSNPTKRITDPQGPYVYIVVTPVHGRWPHEPGTPPVGYVFGTYPFGKVYEHVVSRQPKGNQRLYIFASDTDDAKPVYLHRGGYRGKPLPVPDGMPTLAEVRKMPWYTENVVRMGDRKLTFATVAERVPSLWSYADLAFYLFAAAGPVLAMVVYRLARRRQEENLRIDAQAVSYRALLDGSGDAFITLDTHGNITDWSQSAERLFQRTAASVTGVPISGLMSSVPLPAADARIGAVTPVGRQAIVGVGRISDAAGNLVPVEYALSASDATEARHYFLFIRNIADRLRTEQRLKRFELILDASPSPIVFVDRDLCYEMANDAYLKLVGRERSEVLGRAVRDIVPAEQYPQIEDSLHSALAGHINKFGLHIRHQGPLRYLEITQVPYFGDLPDPEGVIVSFHDVTQRQELIARLENASQRYRQLFEDSPVMYLTVTEHEGEAARITLCNDTACTTLGYTREELMAVPADRLLRPGSPSLLHPDTEGIVTAATTFRPAELLTKAGATLSVMYRVTREADEAGEHNQYRLAVIDVSAQEALRAALTDSELQFRHLVDALPQQVWVTDNQGSLVYLSPQMTDFLGTGTQSPESGQEAIWHAIHPDDLGPTEQAWNAALRDAEAKPFRYEFRLRRQDGQYRWLECQAIPIRGPAGEVVRWIGTNNDVTERRQTEERLRNSQKMEAIGQLTGGLAHDFNNLLGIVIGNLDMLSLSAPNEEARRRTSVALNAAERGAELVKSLLSVARRQALSPERANLSALIHRLLPLIQHSVGKKIEVTCSIGQEHDAVVDVAGLEAALLNVVINARDAMPLGGKIAISMNEATAEDTRGLKPGPYATIEVRDNGTGMPPEVLARATEPFFTTKERGSGTGLGLAMAAGFAEQSGGHLRLESAENRGTAIRFVLPVLASERHGAQPDAVASAPETGSGRILIVDDEADLKSLLQEWMKALGYRTTVASNGQEALDILRGQRFDMVITDIVMPGALDGVELARRASEIHPGIKILLVSGYPDSAVKVMDELAWPLIAKPYRRNEIAAAVASLLADKPTDAHRKIPVHDTES